MISPEEFQKLSSIYDPLLKIRVDFKTLQGILVKQKSIEDTFIRYHEFQYIILYCTKVLEQIRCAQTPDKSSRVFLSKLEKEVVDCVAVVKSELECVVNDVKTELDLGVAALNK